MSVIPLEKYISEIRLARYWFTINVDDIGSRPLITSTKAVSSSINSIVLMYSFGMCLSQQAQLKFVWGTRDIYGTEFLWYNPLFGVNMSANSCTLAPVTILYNKIVHLVNI